MLTSAPQAACQRLACFRLGSTVEACDSAAPFLVGSLRAWADTGAPAFLQQLLPAHSVACFATSLKATPASATRTPSKHCGHQHINAASSSPAVALPVPKALTISRAMWTRRRRRLPGIPPRRAGDHGVHVQFVCQPGPHLGGFAARLAGAGVLRALISLAAQLRAHCGQAAGRGAGADAGAGDGAAPPDEAAAECFSVYAPHIPPVRHRSQCC